MNLLAKFVPVPIYNDVRYRPAEREIAAVDGSGGSDDLD
jgi:hypothetical protein